MRTGCTVGNEQTSSSHTVALAKGAAKIGAGAAIGMAAHYFFSCLIAHQGRQSNGDFHLALAVLGTLTTISGLGFATGISRFVSMYGGRGEPERQRGVVRVALLCVLLTSALCGVVLVLGRNFLAQFFGGAESLATLFLLTGVMLPLGNVAALLRRALLAQNRPGARVLIFDIAGNITLLATGAMLVFIGLGALGGVAAQGVSLCVSCVIAWFTVRWGGVFPRCSPDTRGRLVELVKFSFPVLLSTVLVATMTNIDVLMLGWLRGRAQVGLYKGAFLLLTPVNMATLLVNPLVVPTVTREYSAGRLEAARECARTAGRWLLLLLVPLVVAISLARKPLGLLLLGPEYSMSLSIVLALAAVKIWTFLNLPARSLLVASGRMQTMPIISAVSLTCNICLNFVLIPRAGVLGAAMATAVSVFVQTVLMSLLAAQVAGVPKPLRGFALDVLKVGSCGLISLSAGYLVSTLVRQGTMVDIVLALGALALMGLLIRLLKVFRAEDCYVLEAGLRKIGASRAVPWVRVLLSPQDVPRTSGKSPL